MNPTFARACRRTAIPLVPFAFVTFTYVAALFFVPDEAFDRVDGDGLLWDVVLGAWSIGLFLCAGGVIVALGLLAAWRRPWRWRMLSAAGVISASAASFVTLVLLMALAGARALGSYGYHEPP